MRKPIVTVGLPAFNASHTILLAVLSVFAQTADVWELIIIDDGSSDGTSRVLRFWRQDRRVRIITHAKNEGLVSCLNEIAVLAKGSVIARVDADDVMHPRRLEEQLGVLRSNSEADVVGTGAYVIDGANRVIGVRGCTTPQFSAALAVRSGLLMHPTIMGRSEWFLRNPYDPAFYRAEDHELWCRTATNTVFAHISKPLHFYREQLVGYDTKYLQSCRTDRKVIRKYGHAYVGLKGMIALLALSLAKEFTCRALAAVGQEELLVRRRNLPLPAYEYADAQIIVDGIVREAKAYNAKATS